MTRILRYALIPALVAGFSLSSMACKTTCKDGVCTSTSTQEFIGTPVKQEVDWNAGQKVLIDVRGGNVRVGSTAAVAITVNPGTSSKIQITFTPINNDTAENKDKAVREMGSPANGGSITFNAGPAVDGSGAVAISNVNSGTHSSGLSARIDVLVPPNFDGELEAIADFGDVSVAGVNKRVVASTGLGDVFVELNAALPPGLAGGQLFSKFGDVKLRVPSASNINIQATADGADETVITPATLPTGWTEARAAVNSVTLQANGGSATVWTADSKNGSVYLEPF
jgi:hypothetical protein